MVRSFGRSAERRGTLGSMTSDALFLIPADGPDGAVTFFLAVSGIALFFCLCALNPLFHGKDHGKRFYLIMAALAVAAGITTASLFNVLASQEKALNEAAETVAKNRIAFFEERGVRVPDFQWSSLEFPREEPTEDERFGIAQAEYGGKVVSVLLAWEDGELKLYSTDGEELRPVR